MYMTSTLQLFTGDSGLTTCIAPSTQDPVKLPVSHDDQSHALSMYYMCMCVYCFVLLQYINLLSTVFVVFKEDELSQTTNL